MAKYRIVKEYNPILDQTTYTIEKKSFWQWRSISLTYAFNSTFLTLGECLKHYDFLTGKTKITREIISEK